MKTPIIIVGIALVLVGVILFWGRLVPTSSTPSNIQNVSVVDGKQIIEITARGGYIPRVSVAQPGLPTVIRFVTNGTFDCSASVRIPSMNISKLLANSGSTDIDIGTQQAGTLRGTCGMGMYPFEIQFKS